MLAKFATVFKIPELRTRIVRKADLLRIPSLLKSADVLFVSYGLVRRNIESSPIGLRPARRLRLNRIQ